MRLTETPDGDHPAPLAKLAAIALEMSQAQIGDAIGENGSPHMEDASPTGIWQARHAPDEAFSTAWR